MSPATARRLGVDLGSYAHGGEHGGYHPDVELTVGDRSVRAPVWILPGHADDAITVTLGYGRERAGRVGGTAEAPVNFNPYPLRTTARPWFVNGVQVIKTGDRALVACTQQHHLMENRHLVRGNTLDQFRREPRFAHEHEEDKLREQTRRGVRRPLTMVEPPTTTRHRWGMAIDLTACTGCSACVVACQAENNIPVVGKVEVSRGR